ncbi:MAG: GIY-YIG nuclease family protein [Candidatus Pacebacteria bacterium]|nr:GIY-YIG nuclease family protein [Candidatus Paceibacterota bacterium]
MFYLYILGSRKDRDIYIGSTSDLKRRLIEHNSEKVLSTKSRTPLELLYYEAYKTEQEARERESSLKLRGQARVQLLKRINFTLKLFRNEN